MVGSCTGTVAKWLNHKGIGFIKPDDGGDDLLAHYTEIKGEAEAFRSLAEGSKVAFEKRPDPKNAEKLVAAEITGLDGGPPASKPKGTGAFIEDDDDKKERTRPTVGKIGRVSKWINERGLGFITPEEGGDDLLVRFDDIYSETEGAFRSLCDGARVEYDTKPDPQKEGALLAANVTAVGGGEPRPKGKGKGKGRKGGKGGKGGKSKGKDGGKGKSFAKDGDKGQK